VIFKLKLLKLFTKIHLEQCKEDGSVDLVRLTKLPDLSFLDNRGAENKFGKRQIVPFGEVVEWMNETYELDLQQQKILQDRLKYTKLSATQKLEMKFSLFEAASNGEIELLKSLLFQGVHINSTDEVLRFRKFSYYYQQGRTILHLASIKGNLLIVKFILQNKNAPLNVEDKQGKTALFLTVSEGKSKVTKVLLRGGK
jgi:hypothetical protein